VQEICFLESCRPGNEFTRLERSQTPAGLLINEILKDLSSS
jgi:hypothetical protein